MLSFAHRRLRWHGAGVALLRLVPSWARLVHSASWFRAADKAQQAVNSRANRYLHWMDMLRLRELGFASYDLGGWYSGQEDVEKLNINRFKEGFGGRVVPQYNCDCVDATRLSHGPPVRGYTRRGHR